MSRRSNGIRLSQCQGNGITAAVEYGTLDEVKAAVKRGEGAKVLDEDGRNLVFYASLRKAALEERALKIVRYLVEEKGVSPTLRDCSVRQTSLYYAVREGNYDVAKYLIQKASDVNNKDMNAQTPLFYAARYGMVDCCRLLLERKASPAVSDVNGQTVVSYITKGNVAAAEGIIRLFADKGPAGFWNQPDGRGVHPLYVLPDVKNTGLLLELKADPNWRDCLNQTVLFYAARDGLLEKTRLLIKHKACVDAQDIVGHTPLFYAVKSSRLEMCRMLVEDFGADPYHEDNHRESPASLAAKDAKLRAVFNRFGTSGGRPNVRGQGRRIVDGDVLEISPASGGWRRVDAPVIDLEWESVIDIDALESDEEAKQACNTWSGRRSSIVKRELSFEASPNKTGVRTIPSPSRTAVAASKDEIRPQPKRRRLTARKTIAARAQREEEERRSPEERRRARAEAWKKFAPYLVPGQPLEAYCSVFGIRGSHKHRGITKKVEPGEAVYIEFDSRGYKWTERVPVEWVGGIWVRMEAWDL